MSDNQVTKLLEACSSDPELLNKLQNTMPEDALSVVQAMGYDISQEDIEKLSSSVSEDLTDAELEAAAGGQLAGPCGPTMQTNLYNCVFQNGRNFSLWLC